MSHTSFNCPYCWRDVPVQASVCGHCTRDLVLFKPLALQLQTLNQEVVQLKALVQQQAQTLTQIQGQNIPSAALTYVEKHEPSGQAPTHAISSVPSKSWPIWLGMVVLTVISIGLCHWVLLFAYDAPPLFLRLMTITLPALTGYICARQSGLSGSAQLLAALLVSVCSVGLMLGITAHIDGVPLLPANTRDWRETLEYTAAIGLAFFTGYLVHRLTTRWRQKQNHKISLQILLSRDEKGRFKITEISDQVQSLISAAAPLFSGGVALYSGLKAFTGH